MARLSLVLGALFVLCTAALAYTFPPLTGRVVDQANVIPADTRAAIEAKLKTLEDKSQIQFVVATVKSLEGDEIEPYANALFRAWKLGQKDKNNGLLLLVAPTEHRVRFEVGYGLEGTLTDALSKVIISNAIAPRFKAGDFGGGITRGVDDAITVLTTDSSEWQKKPALRVDHQGDNAWVPFVVLGVFIFIFILIMRSPQRGNILWFILGMLTNSGGRGGGGFGGGGSSGGGFSGGGGSSGGGGASGSW